MPKTPDNIVFKLFYYVGYIYIIGAFLAGSYVTYDWFKNRRKNDGNH